MELSSLRPLTVVMETTVRELEDMLSKVVFSNTCIDIPVHIYGDNQSDTIYAEAESDNLSEKQLAVFAKHFGNIQEHKIVADNLIYRMFDSQIDDELIYPRFMDEDSDHVLIEIPATYYFNRIQTRLYNDFQEYTDREELQ